MSLVLLLIGAAMMLTGSVNIAFREAIVARHRARSPGRAGQSSYAYLVMGAILVIGGTLMFVASLVKLI